MSKLEKIRAQIAQLSDEIKAVENARPPLDDQIRAVRDYLAALCAPVDALIERCADVLTYGTSPNSIDDIPPVRLAHHAFAAGVAALGVEHLVACAVERASAADGGALRMTDEEKTERLQALRRQRYALEIEEEATRGKEPRRPGVSGGVLLGLSVDEAERRGMI
ncbi:MAG: hypothetical protein PWP11_1199 [Thauera sp.]|nr:hypothetical protein [Thauera sp.]MDI3489922.1 hypothetical protein [Thauera sp.]